MPSYSVYNNFKDKKMVHVIPKIIISDYYTYAIVVIINFFSMVALSYI